MKNRVDAGIRKDVWVRHPLGKTKGPTIVLVKGKRPAQKGDGNPIKSTPELSDDGIASLPPDEVKKNIREATIPTTSTSPMLPPKSKSENRRTSAVSLSMHSSPGIGNGRGRRRHW